MRFARLQKNFETLARTDPYWTVLSDPSKREREWDPEEFFQSGEDVIRSLEERLAPHHLRTRGQRALDFGCGVGRLTFPLSRRFDHAIGVDLSATMLEEARRNKGRGNSCEFILNTEDSLSFLEPRSLDFAYSDIVFQHMAPSSAKRYFLEIAEALKPGGSFAFQLPSHPLYKRRIGKRRLFYRLKALRQFLGGKKAYFEMNAIPLYQLINYIETNAHLRLVTLWDYPVAGPYWQSYLYVFKKR